MRERQNREFWVMVYLYPLFAGSILATVLQLPRSQQYSWCYYLRTRKIRYKMKRGRELSCMYSQQIGQNGRRRNALTLPLQKKKNLFDASQAKIHLHTTFPLLKIMIQGPVVQYRLARA